MFTAAGYDVRSRRNRALLSLAFDTDLRRSKLVALRWPNIESGGAGGGRLFVPRPKGDQAGASAYAYVSARTMTALEASRSECRGPRDGATFCRLHFARDKSGAEVWSIGIALTAQSVALIFRTLLEGAPDAGLLGTVENADFDT